MLIRSCGSVLLIASSHSVRLPQQRFFSRDYLACLRLQTFLSATPMDFMRPARAQGHCFDTGLRGTDYVLYIRA